MSPVLAFYPEAKVLSLNVDRNDMKYILLVFISLPSFSLADSCLPLYEKRAEEIQKKNGYTKYVGGYFYYSGRNVEYWPGIKVQADIDNWAEDLVYAIKWGPKFFTYSLDERKEWLEYFRKSVKDDCKLPKNDYKKLQAMLNQLMEDGSFCPNGEILEPRLIGGKRDFKLIFQAAVKDKFSDLCEDKSVNNSPSRSSKETPSSSGESKTDKGSAQ